MVRDVMYDGWFLFRGHDHFALFRYLTYFDVLQVRTGRCIRGYALPPHCNRAERREVERILCDALGKLDGPLKVSSSVSFTLALLCELSPSFFTIITSYLPMQLWSNDLLLLHCHPWKKGLIHFQPLSQLLASDPPQPDGLKDCFMKHGVHSL